MSNMMCAHTHTHTNLKKKGCAFHYVRQNNNLHQFIKPDVD